jgi:hypothetical protein
MFLADQFRSASGIVDYINGEFYVAASLHAVTTMNSNCRAT